MCAFISLVSMFMSVLLNLRFHFIRFKDKPKKNFIGLTPPIFPTILFNSAFKTIIELESK